MGVSPWIIIFLLIVLVQVFVASADTNAQDTSGLKGIAGSWDSAPSNWAGNDPCGDKWIGIICTGNRVTSMLKTVKFRTVRDAFWGHSVLIRITVPGLILQQELARPPSFNHWNLEQAPKLNSCRLRLYRSLNSNKFTGSIPPSLGGLSKLYWFDLADNQLTGGLPISNATSPGLDNLTSTKHLLLDNNKFSGSIPSTLGLLNTLEVLRFDNNAQLTGPVPTNLNNLTKLAEFHLANSNLTGPLPDLTGMSSLSFVYLENLRISGEVPQSLFSLPSIQTLRLRGNRLNGTLNIADFSSQLQLVDLRDNFITVLTVGTQYKKTLMLSGNPYCNQVNDDAHCKATGQSNPALPPYKTTSNCPALPPQCLSTQQLSPTCICSVPYRGTLFFRSPGFSDLGNSSYFIQLEGTMKTKFLNLSLPVDSIAIHDPFVDANNNLEMSLEVYPSGKDQFSEQDISGIGFILSNQTYKPPSNFGPYYFLGQTYSFANGALQTSKSNTNHIPLIVGASVGGAAVVAALLALTICIARRKRSPKQTEDRSQSYVSWDIKSTSTSTAPQVRGARMFSFDELKKVTNNFSEANDIGTGGYGKVYRGTLPTGQLVAVKRSQQGSLQGNLEFRTEIELLSRVHHKNVVSLVGFCFDQGEQMLVYEYVPNGTLKESLTGKSGVRLDWKRRLRVVLGAAKGIAYLHELADPPIIHRDIKSSNVLLDERLNAKVSDFGLSKLLGEDGRGQITTQVKGTMGYLDPEYYMTQQLTDRSDVYSFGVLLLEVITARKPLERGRYVVREVKEAVDRRKDMYGLHELLDPALGASSALAGLEPYVDLALRCVEESGADRPSMGEAVAEIERIAKVAGAGGAAAAESAASDSMSYAASRTPRHPYGGGGGDSASEYSGGGLPSMRVEPK
uniref:non-specific serine/threonine protein kinase n=1 Tax=Oryza glumipatula TaxID=40148 RepID=A0A0E0BQE7_9ORYZ